MKTTHRQYRTVLLAAAVLLAMAVPFGACSDSTETSPTTDSEIGDSTTDTDTLGSGDAGGDPSFPLRVAGNTFVDSQGQPVAVRALDLVGSSSGRWRNDLQRPSTSVLQQASDLGFNVVVLPFRETWFYGNEEPASGPHPLDDEAFGEVFEPWLAAARQAGVYLVLALDDAHTTNLWFPTDIGVIPADRGTLELYVRLWTYVSAHLDNDATVAGYLLMRKPNPTSARDDGGCPECVGVPENPEIWYEVAGRVVAALRARGDDRLVFIEPSTTYGEGYDTDLFASLEDDAVVFAPRFLGPMAMAAGSSYPGWIALDGQPTCFASDTLRAQTAESVGEALADGRPVWLQDLGMAIEAAEHEGDGFYRQGSYLGYLADLVGAVESQGAGWGLLSYNPGEGFSNFGPFRYSRESGGDLTADANPIRMEPAASQISQVLEGAAVTGTDTCQDPLFLALDAQPFGADLASGECVVVYEQVPTIDGQSPVRTLTYYDALGRQTEERTDVGMDDNFNQVLVRRYEDGRLIAEESDYGGDGVFENQTTYTYDDLGRTIGEHISVGEGATTSDCVGSWTEAGDECEVDLCFRTPVRHASVIAATVAPPADPNPCAECGYQSWVCGESSGCRSYDNADVFHYGSDGELVSRTQDWVDDGLCCGNGASCACPPDPIWDVDCNLGEVNNRWVYDFDQDGALAGWSMDRGASSTVTSNTTYAFEAETTLITTETLDGDGNAEETQVDRYQSGQLIETAVSDAEGNLVERHRVFYNDEGHPTGESRGRNGGSGFRVTQVNAIDAESGQLVWMCSNVLADHSGIGDSGFGQVGLGRYCAP